MGTFTRRSIFPLVIWNLEKEIFPKCVWQRLAQSLPILLLHSGLAATLPSLDFI